jgi:hypothetical protein
MKSRTDFPPGQWCYLQPQTGWNAIPGSFDAVVRQVIGHRAGNRAITKQYNLPTDYEAVGNEVDEFNALRCVAAGWNNFVIEAPPPSFRAPTPFKRLSNAVVGGSRRIVAGVKAIALWLGDGLKPVSQELAERRAAVCAVCPANVDPNFVEKLSAVGAAEVKTMMAIKHDLTLKTPHDDKLYSCRACGCWNPLSVWCKLDHITATMSPEVRSKLDPSCWKTAELRPQDE